MHLVIIKKETRKEKKSKEKKRKGKREKSAWVGGCLWSPHLVGSGRRIMNSRSAWAAQLYHALTPKRSKYR
jgi:hypothetical protein